MSYSKSMAAKIFISKTEKGTSADRQCTVRRTILEEGILQDAGRGDNVLVIDVDDDGTVPLPV